MFKNLILFSLGAVALGVNLRDHSHDSVLSLSGDISLPVSLSVGQARLARNENDCPYEELLE